MLPPVSAPARSSSNRSVRSNTTGPISPLGTAAIIADAISNSLISVVTCCDVAVTPTIAYGLSSEHAWASGTFTLSATTHLALLNDVAASVVRLGVERLALLNTHGGNTHLLRVICREIRVRHGLQTFLIVPMRPPDNGGSGGDPRENGLGIHGHADETSLMLYLHLDLVDIKRAARSVPSFWTILTTLASIGRPSSPGSRTTSPRVE
jgi:creatinine amidohydrolase